MTKHEPGGRSEPPCDDENDENVMMRVHGAHQLLAVLPQMMGYHPDHSLVLVVTALSRGPGTGPQLARVLLSCRLDLPAAQDLREAVCSLVPALRQTVSADPDEVRLLHVFGYDVPEDPDGRVGLVPALRSAMHQLADDIEAHLHDLLLVRHRGRSVREVVAQGEDLDPMTGWSPAVDPLDVPAAADLALRGRGALRSRQELVTLVRRRDEEASRATASVLAARSVPAEQGPSGYLEGLLPLAAWVLDGNPPTVDQRALITRVLDDRWARDAILARWVPDMFPLSEVLGPDGAAELCRLVPAWEPRDREGTLDRLLTLVGQVPVERTAPLLTVTGFLAWSAGEGTLANEACELALEADRGYVMAQLLAQALAHGLRPPRSGRRSPRSTRAHPDRRPAA